jgi:basic amino acid/polyamine antiporter, APA family
VINVLATSLGFYWPVVTAGPGRTALIAAITLILAAINIRGIRQSSAVVNVLTVGKLLPLTAFAAVGLFQVDPARLAAAGIGLTYEELAASALLLIFGFGGYEVVPVPAGEARDPRRAVPFALVMTLLIVTALMTVVQIVAVGTLPGLAASKTPLADAAAIFMGAGGAAMLTLGAVLSTTGNNMGQALSGSRNLYALAEQGDLPAVFGWVHPVYRTPAVAIVVTAAVALTLAVSGTFAAMAAASAISRLLVYVATCASVLRLRSESLAGRVNAASFVVPFGPVIPVAAIIIALTILAGASPQQRLSGVVAFAAGAVLYLAAVHRRVPTPDLPLRGRVPR